MTLIPVHVFLTAFAILNWVPIVAPVTLSLVVADVSARLGMGMLVFTAVISGLFIVSIVLFQAGVIFEARRLTRIFHRYRQAAPP